MPIGKISDFDEGKGKSVKIDDDTQVAVFKIGGKIFVIEESCPHQGGPLSEGEVEGLNVICPWHQMKYELESGNSSSDAWDKEYKVKAFKVILEGEDVKIEIPDL